MPKTSLNPEGVITMTADERLAPIRVKIERAKEHIRDLEVEVRSFLMTNPYIVGPKRNPQTRQLIYYLVSVRDTSPRISAIIGDVIHNLRSALDHLAYQLVLVGGGTPSKQTYFPISEDAAKYKTERPGKVKGMRPDAIKAIDAIKPYGGGNDLLWRLHRLDNVDKHRLLITCGSAYNSVNIGPMMHRSISQVWREAGFDQAREIPVFDLFIRPADRLFPLKAGDELFIDAPDAEVNEHMQFRFDVAFGEPQVLEGEPLIETLHQMADLVDHLVSSFAPLLI
jgi:hypothetical protein